MESVVEKLQRVGLTEYEAKSYLALLNTHLSTATKVSEKTGVPRTKIYAVLESLKRKGISLLKESNHLLFDGLKRNIVAQCLRKTIEGFSDMFALLFEIVKWAAIVFGVFLFWLFVVVRFVRHYFHFPIPAFATQLIDNPIRRRLIQRPEVIADRMQLHPGMMVVEIGPGKGSYTKAVARKVLPDGRVYAVDIQELVIKRLKERVRRERISNIEPRIDNAYNFSLRDESVDRVLAVACLPEIPDPVKVLRECYRILRRNGQVSLCELMLDPDYPRRQTEKRWALEAGFKLEKEFGNVFLTS
jgi:hypothetical protein